MEQKRKKQSNVKEESTKASAAASKSAAKVTEKKAEVELKPKAEEPEKKGRNSTYLIVGIMLVIVLFVIYFLFFAASNATGASFPSFKSNFNSAPRIAVTVVYGNTTQLGSETPCYIRLLEVLSGTRGASTIDFSIVNQTKCTYSPTGLGHTITPVTENASVCLATAENEPGIFLNYSNSNTTVITPYRLYINANATYFNSCPIAAEFA